MKNLWLRSLTFETAKESTLIRNRKGNCDKTWKHYQNYNVCHWFLFLTHLAIVWWWVTNAWRGQLKSRPKTSRPKMMAKSNLRKDWIKHVLVRTVWRNHKGKHLGITLITAEQASNQWINIQSWVCTLQQPTWTAVREKNKKGALKLTTCSDQTPRLKDLKDPIASIMIKYLKILSNF